MAGLFFLGGPLTTTKHLPHHHHNNNTKEDDHDHDSDHHIFFTTKESNHQLWSSEESYFTLRVGPAPPFDDHQLTGSGLAAAMMMRSGRGGAAGSGSGGGGGGGINCQDCGNQAKKDCPHMRCRTCCKSRGLPCSTHVKSTWVPAAKRRERQQQQQLAAMQLQQQQQQQQQQNVPKRPRDQDQHQMLTLPPLTYPTASTGLEVADFPSELNSPALFRCVRVSAMEEEDEEYAYQTALNIGGHVFKGILYDQGPEQSTYPTTTVVGESSSRGGSGAQLPLNLITTAATTATTTNNNVTPTNMQQAGANLVDPSSSLVYPAPLSGFMGIGTQFFPPPRS